MLRDTDLFSTNLHKLSARHLELRMKYAQIDFSNTGRDGLRLKPT